MVENMIVKFVKILSKSTTEAVGKKVRVLFLKSTPSTIKRPTSKLKIMVIKFVKKYGPLAQLATAPVL